LQPKAVHGGVGQGFLPGPLLLCITAHLTSPDPFSEDRAPNIPSDSAVIGLVSEKREP